MRRHHLNIRALTAALILAVMGGWIAAVPGAQADGVQLFEIVLRSDLTSSTPVYEEGREGDPSAIIGFETTSNAYLIGVPITNGILPSPDTDLGAPIGTITSTLRFPEGVYMDQSQESQILSGTARLTMESLSIAFAGTVIVRWVHDEQGLYQGTRWTDFSMGITETTGTVAGWKGHVVGTRLLVGDPLTDQSGILIFRLTQ